MKFQLANYSSGAMGLVTLQSARRGFLVSKIVDILGGGGGQIKDPFFVPAAYFLNLFGQSGFVTSTMAAADVKFFVYVLICLHIKYRIQRQQPNDMGHYLKHGPIE